MAKIDLKHVQRFRDRHGHLRHYFRKPGCKRIALPGLPGSTEFMEAYAAALGTVRTVGEAKSAPGSISALVAGYYASAEWGSLKPQTQYNYRRVLERFREKYGDLPAGRMREQDVWLILDEFADRPQMAKVWLKRLRGLFGWAKKRKLVTTDPTKDVKFTAPKTSGFRPWTDDDIERFEGFWGPGTRARLALYLLIYTTQRRSDVVLMGRQHVRDGGITVTQTKRGQCQEAVTLVIPVHPKLQAEIDLLPADQLMFLITEYGKPMSPAGFSNWFSECARKAGLPPHSSPHGLRKAGARWLAEAGASAMQVASVTGHSSLKEVERYTRSAAQAHLAKAAIAALKAGS